MKHRIVQTLLTAVVCLGGGMDGYGATLDSRGHGSVSIGEVRSGFGGLNTEVQNNTAALTFALQEQQQHVCIDASGRPNGEFTWTKATPLLAKPITNGQGRGITGFELNGFDPAGKPTVDEPPKGCTDGGPVKGSEARITIKICFRDFWITIIIDL